MSKKNTKTISRILWENAAWLLGIGFAIVNLYVASVISPLQSDISVNAEKIEQSTQSINDLTDMHDMVIANGQKIDYIYEDIKYIKASLSD